MDIPTEQTVRKTRRMACDVCRERKVRCDRRQPQCERCIRLGHRCAYTVYTTASSVDIPQLLLRLHSRLERAEAQLAKSNAPGHGTIDMDGLPDFAFADALPAPNPELHALPQLAGSQYSPRPCQQRAAVDTARTPAAPQHVAADLDQSPPGAVQQHSPPPMTSLPDLFMGTARKTYFEVLHPALPMVHRPRLEEDLQAPQHRLELQSLAHAIAMAGGAAHPGQEQLVAECYRHARRHLEEAEREEPGASFLTIRALQALLLVTYYEIKKTDFTRAWMTLGRALRLARCMALHRIDAPADSVQSSIQLPLPPATDEAEVEERRRTFWVAFVFDAYVSVRTGSVPAFAQSEISTFLPLPSDELYDDPFQPRTRLEDVVLRHSANGPISTFGGLAVMSAIAGASMKHAEAAHQTHSSPNYGFWSEHFRIEKTLAAAIDLLADKTSKPHDMRPLLLHLNLRGIVIFLHDAALARAEWDIVPPTLISESRKARDNAALAIANMLSRTSSLDAQNVTTFRQLNTFTMWSLSCAARVLTDMCNTMSGEQSPCRDEAGLAALRLLYSTMESLGDESESWRPLLQEMVLHLSAGDVQCMFETNGAEGYITPAFVDLEEEMGKLDYMF